MENKNKKLRILGRASATVLKKLQSHAHIAIKENAILLFVSYTFNEFKTGSLFDIFIEESNQSWNHDYKIKLDKVYDEFGSSFDFVPEGYKTLCLFECKPHIPAAIRKLPALKTWEVTDRSLYLCNHSDIDLLHNEVNGSILFKSLSDIIVYNLRQKKKKTFTEQEVANMLPNSSSRFIIDNLVTSGALKKTNNKLVLAE